MKKKERGLKSVKLKIKTVTSETRNTKNCKRQLQAIICQ